MQLLGEVVQPGNRILGPKAMASVHNLITNMCFCAVLCLQLLGEVVQPGDCILVVNTIVSMHKFTSAMCAACCSCWVRWCSLRLHPGGQDHC
jgi:hypothetical protein